MKMRGKVFLSYRREGGLNWLASFVTISPELKGVSWQVKAVSWIVKAFKPELELAKPEV
jgi:hypothetical protein